MNLNVFLPGFILRKMGGAHETRNKFHVSINRDPSNLSKAFNVIFPILEKYQIAYFKIIPPTCSVEAKDNSLGKEYTIYIQDVEGSEETQPDFWSHHVLKEIVENLERKSIIPGEFPKADIPVKGSKNFIYTRAPHNFFDNYIPADFLEKLEFSREESANLSPSLWVNLVIDGYSEIEALLQQQPKNRFETIPEIFLDIKSEAERIYIKFIDSLLFREKYLNINAPALYFLVAGMHDANKLGGSKELKMLEFLFDDLHRKVGKDPIRLVVDWPILKTAPLEMYLKKAAFLTALFEIESPLEDIGNIHPAIYHSFLVPLAKKIENMVNDNASGLFDHNEEKQLVSHIATCALRNGMDLSGYYVVGNLDIGYKQEGDDESSSWDFT